MGNRANIAIQYSDGNKIFFYTHWDGCFVDNVVQSALIRGKERWNDESYLARIIFCELVKSHPMDLTGYGISPYEIEAGSPLCFVDMEEKTIANTMERIFTFEEYINFKLPDND